MLIAASLAAHIALSSERQLDPPTAPASVAKNGDNAHDNSNPAGDNEAQINSSNALFAAAEAVDSGISLGPVSACFDQMRAFACPIIGNIPVIGEVIGMISLEFGISCPTGASNPDRT